MCLMIKKNCYIFKSAHIENELYKNSTVGNISHKHFVAFAMYRLN